MSPRDASAPYGYGQDGRPLFTRTDRDGEIIREVLRGSARREFGRNPRRPLFGFVVEPESERTHLVTCAGDGDESRCAVEVVRYTVILKDAGFHVWPAHEGLALRVRPGPALRGRLLRQRIARRFKPPHPLDGRVHG